MPRARIALRAAGLEAPRARPAAAGRRPAEAAVWLRVPADAWALLAIAAVVALANAPSLLAFASSNPLGPRSGLMSSATPGPLPGERAIDPNDGYVSQALGHRAALDWAHLRVPWWNPYEGTGAPLAGEMSGHIFFADGYYGFDDAVYVAVRLLAILSRTGESLAELRDRLPEVFNTPELRFPCDEARKFEVVREVRDRLRQAEADMTDIDGVRVRTADGWWLLRASNTQAVLVARAESATEEGLARLKKELAAELRVSGVALPDG